MMECSGVKILLTARVFLVYHEAAHGTAVCCACAAQVLRVELRGVCVHGERVRFAAPAIGVERKAPIF